MRIYVVNLGGRDPHVVEYKGATDQCALDSVLYVSVSRRISLLELDSQLKALRSQWRRAGQVIVLRLHSPAAELLQADESVVATLQQRFEGLPMLLAHLGEDRSIQLTQLGAAVPAVHDPTQLLEAVRSAELHSWLQQPGVVMPANNHFHYEGPNGCRYESFMRVGTAIQGTETLDAVAFWLQPYLDDSPAVVLDAWTIISVALNLGRYASQTGSPCASPGDVECLGAYDEDMDRLRTRLLAILGRAEKRPPALLISSVVSMGNLHRQLEALIREVGFADVRSVSLYGPAGSEGTVFCRPGEIGRYWQPDEECPLETPTVPIAASTYLVEVSTEPQRARIREPNAEQASEFFDRYGGEDFLSVHRDESDTERHHMIHLDVERLVPHPAFAERLNAELQGLPALDAILAPRHPAAAALADAAARRLGTELIVADEGDLPSLPDDQCERLRKASRILLVDDVVISGARLLGYRNFLRRCGFVSPDRRTEIHLLVGVARVRDNLKIAGIEDMVDDHNRFHPVETLLLPDWDKPECPWCWELRQLERFGDEVPLTEKLEERWEMLRNTSRGLRDSLFIPWAHDGDDALPVPVWQLGPGSIFRARTEMDLFVAVASALQSLRAAGDLTERYRYPLAQALDPAFWLSGRYYDPVIAAAILRATRRHDIRTFQLDPDLQEGVSSRLRNPDDLRGELVMAAARGHLPIAPEIAPDGSLAIDPAADPGFAGLMRRILEAPSYSPLT